jgi:SRSO17 transposase
MEEEVDGAEYRAYQHFITNSNWDCDGVMRQLSLDVSAAMEANKARTGVFTGLIIDESAHLKKGVHSVGVSRQYAGTKGSVDNCQVGVYASLVNDTLSTIVDQRLFLPVSWTTDKTRLDQAGVPADKREFKTKPQLALEMVKDLVGCGVKFDWVGGDGLYGHNVELCEGLDKLGQFYVLDVHKDERVYLEEPAFSVPARKSNRGQEPVKTKADKPSVRLDKYCEGLAPDQWKRLAVRKTAKGWLVVDTHVVTVWAKGAGPDKTRKQTLVITRTTDGTNEIKFSFSNGDINRFSPLEYAYFQRQRYWVERSFQDAKSQLGLSDYQVRKWKSWQHHHAIVLLASFYIIQLRADCVDDAPLISVRDARILVVVSLFGSKAELDKRIDQMFVRHEKRQKDIHRRFTSS